MKLSKSLLAACAATALFSGAAMAQDKPFNVYIGYSAGGGYDVYGRLLARHIGSPSPRKSERHRQQHAGRGLDAPRQLAL